MIKHNKNFYSLEEVERCLEASKDFQDGEEIYYFIGALRYVYDENRRLNNIINKLEKWLEQEYAVVNANSIQEPNNPEWYIKWNERKNTLDKLHELKGEK